MKKKLLKGKELEDRADELGVSKNHCYTQAGLNEPELQRRVLEAERANRESKLWLIAVVAAIASVFSAVAAWVAVLNNSDSQHLIGEGLRETRPLSQPIKNGVLEMQIWKLTPLEPNAPAWKQSYYQGVVFVRAGSADKARKHAEAAYIKATTVIPGDHSEQCLHPWLDPVQVSAQISDESEYSVEGDPAIVGPEDAVQHVNEP